MEAYILAFVGGCIIGLASLLLLVLNGNILGISGIVAGTLPSSDETKSWRFLFLAGLVFAGALMLQLRPEAFEFELNRSIGALITAGLLVGFGSRLGRGCTSGHGICGISRFSLRSIVATVTFMATGALTVFLINHLMGGKI